MSEEALLRIPQNHLSGDFYGEKPDGTDLIPYIQSLLNHVDPVGIYAGDNLITWARNLSFLDDEKFMGAFRRHATRPKEQSILWRTSVLVWAALRGLQREGDFVEAGVWY